MKRALLLLLLLAACAAPVSGPKPVAGLTAETELFTDTNGWPHAFGTTLRDAAVAQGYAMARDRMPQMELFRRTASGTLGQAFGAVSEQFLESDVMMRTLGLRRVAEQMWQQTPDGRMRELLEGYSAGVNRYLAEVRAGTVAPPRGSELLVGHATPQWTAVDSLTVLRLMEVFLSFNADAEVNRTLVRDRARELASRPGLVGDLLTLAPPSRASTVPGFYAAAAHPKPDRRRSRGKQPAMESSTAALAALHRVLPASMRLGVGTNAWAVAGSRTASGHALLANDPHLPLIAPTILYGVHLVVTEGPDALDVTGVAFPGVPGVVFGHNAQVAWGITNGMFDQLDVYEETIDGDAVVFNGQRVPLERRVERVPNGFGGTRDVVIETVPHHGPILPGSRTATRALSVKWVALTPTHEVDRLLSLFYARDVREAEDAVRDIEVPGMGFVFADSHGDVAFRMVGRVPIRAPGARTFDPVKNPGGTSPAMVLPGTGEAEWLGSVAAADLPALRAPVIVAANNDPAGLSRDGNPFDERVYLGYEWSEGYRAERIAERLAALDGHATLGDMQAVQADRVMLVAKRFMPFMLAVADGEVAEQLRGWDFDASIDSVPAALFHAWLTRVLDLALTDEIEALGAPAQLLPAQRMAAVLRMLEHPRAGCEVWDDLRTPDVTETRDDVLRAALAAAREDLAAATGTSDMTRWRWGALHTVRFQSALPHFILGFGADLSIPPAPGAFERGGGIDTVDQGWPALQDENGRPAPVFTFAQGAARRFSVELTPEGPKAFDALPGGESGDVSSPHFRDEAELWRTNRVHPLWRTHEEVEANAGVRTLLVPDPR